jgi:putative transposase
VELNPLRAGMVEDPSQYPWSSCSVKTGVREQPWLDFDPFYKSLGKTSDERAEKYGRWLRETTPEEEWKLIREATQRGQLTGGKKFVREISKKLGRRIELRGPGRPKKDKK